jgi:hypothetical protein
MQCSASLNPKKIRLSSHKTIKSSDKNQISFVKINFRYCNFTPAILVLQHFTPAIFTPTISVLQHFTPTIFTPAIFRTATFYTYNFYTYNFPYCNILHLQFPVLLYFKTTICKIKNHKT